MAPSNGLAIQTNMTTPDTTECGKKIKALPTYYRGGVFKSRLEARWAYYFDLIGAKWQYEPDGFTLPSGNYCPDFLVGNSTYVEIKPFNPVPQLAIQKIKEFSAENIIVLCVGEPGPQGQQGFRDGEAFESAYFTSYAFWRKKWNQPFWGEIEDHDPIDLLAAEETRNARADLKGNLHGRELFCFHREAGFYGFNKSTDTYEDAYPI
jgi:hypothetical protein